MAGQKQGRLTGDFKKAWLRQVQKAYLNLIWRHKLPLKSPATLGLMKGQSVWGRWEESSRRLLLSEELFEHPWPAVLGILGHELAHQMVSDLAPEARAGGQPEHGPAFQRQGARLGLSPFYLRATVDLKAQCPRPWPDPEAGPGRGEKALEKVKKLLALSSSPVAAEAQAAMSAAARLMARHNLESLESTNGEGHYEYRLIALGARRLDGRLTRLAHLLSRHFFVKTIFVPSYDPRTDAEGHDLELLGRPENTRLAEHIFHFLMERTESLWRDYHRTHRGGGLVARNSFILSLLDGFNQKLDAAAAEGSIALSPAAPEASGGFSALVLARDQGLNDFYHRRHPRVTTTRPAGRRYCPTSGRAGQAAGRALNFNRPLEEGPAASSPPQLLPVSPAGGGVAAKPSQGLLFGEPL